MVIQIYILDILVGDTDIFVGYSSWIFWFGIQIYMVDILVGNTEINDG